MKRKNKNCILLVEETALRCTLLSGGNYFVVDISEKIGCKYFLAKVLLFLSTPRKFIIYLKKNKILINALNFKLTFCFYYK